MGQSRNRSPDRKIAIHMSRISEEPASARIITAGPRMWAVNFTCLLFILLQSACTAGIAISGISAVIGLGSFATALGLSRFTGSFHADVIRIPMMILALTG